MTDFVENAVTLWGFNQCPKAVSAEELAHSSLHFNANELPLSPLLSFLS